MVYLFNRKTCGKIKKILAVFFVFVSSFGSFFTCGLDAFFWKAGNEPRGSGNPKTIWISTQDDESLFVACNLVFRLHQIDQHVPILITTKTLDAKKVAEDILEPCNNVFVVLLVGNDPLLISRYCYRFNPGCIITVDKKISDPEHAMLTLVSVLKGIPSFLVNAEFGYGLEYQLVMNAHFFRPFFNSFEAICVKQPKDIVRFRDAGIIRPEIFCGDLDSFNVLERKNLFSPAKNQELLSNKSILTSSKIPELTSKTSKTFKDFFRRVVELCSYSKKDVCLCMLKQNIGLRSLDLRPSFTRSFRKFRQKIGPYGSLCKKCLQVRMMNESLRKINTKTHRS